MDRAAGPPPVPSAPGGPPQPGDAQWPSQCEQLTGITYRYRKGTTEAWQRERLARVRRPPAPRTEA